MAGYGDNYNWQVTFDTTGVNQANQAVETIKAVGKATTGAAEGAKYYRDAQGRLRDELGRFVGQAKQAELAAQGVAVAARQAGDVAEEAGGGSIGGGRGGGKGFAALSGGILQFSQLAEDAQFGVRGLQNNISGLILAVGGYSPVAMAAAGATTILTSVFRDEIDAMLAAAGVLDENLVKGMEKGKEATDAFAEAQRGLLASLPEVTEKLKGQVAAVGELAKKVEGTTAAKLIEDAIIQETGYRAGDLKKATDDIARLEKERDAAMALSEADPANEMKRARSNNAIGALERARAVPATIVADQQEFARKNWAMQAAQAGSSDEAAFALSQRLSNLGNQKGNEDLHNLAKAILEGTQTFKTAQENAAFGAATARDRAEKRREIDAKIFEPGGVMSGAVAEVQGEILPKQAERRAKAEDERIGDLYKGFGGSLEDAAMKRLMGGQAPEDIGAALMGQAEDLGVGSEDAFAIVLEAIKEAQKKRTEMTREQAIELQELFRQQAEDERKLMEQAMGAGWQARMNLRQQYQQMRGQNPWRNGRPNGL